MLKYFAAVVLLAAAASAASVVPPSYAYPAQPAVYPGVPVNAAAVGRQYSGVVQPQPYSQVAYPGQVAYTQPAVAYAGQPAAYAQYVQPASDYAQYAQPAYAGQNIHV